MEKIVILLGIFLISIAFVMHAPIFKINKKIKKQIIEKGLIHFTSIKSANNILVEGFHGNYSNMKGEGKLGKLVWTYLYSDDIDRYHQYLVNKKGKERIQTIFKFAYEYMAFRIKY